jgi:hypothetical protein
VEITGTVKKFLYLTKYYAMETNWGVDVWIHIFLTSALVGGERSASGPGRFTPEEEPQVPIVQEAGWAPEQVWTIWRSQNSCPYRESNSDPSVFQHSGSRYTDSYCTKYATINYH